jgi:hypothetical protein
MTTTERSSHSETPPAKFGQEEADMAKDKEISVTIYLRVHDEEAFRRAARDRALEDGVDESKCEDFLKASEKSLGECAIMLFDPGMSPDGADILDSVSD